MPDAKSRKGAYLDIEERRKVYDLLAILNTGFYHIVESIVEVGAILKPPLSPERMSQLEELAKECQGEINVYLLEHFRITELADRDLFGRVRKAREEWQTFPPDKPDKPEEPES